MENFSINEDLIVRWLNNELTEEELEQFKATKDYNYYKRIINETDSWTLPEVDLSKSYQLLSEKKSNSKKNGKSVFMSFTSWKLGVAASLLILIGYFTYSFFQNSDTVTFKTLAGQTEEIKLPDGSIIYLNAGSEISYRRKKWKTGRKVRLAGNAYFDVVKGGAFEVVSEHGSVSVKGTEFEINDGSSFYTVACLEGRVEVEVIASDVKVTLDSSDVVSYTREKGIYRSKTGRKKLRSWANNKSSFTNAPLSQVFSSMEKQFDVTIDISAIDKNRKFTGEFLHSSIETALKMVCTPMRITYTIKDKKITLKPMN